MSEKIVSIRSSEDIQTQLQPLYDAWYRVETEMDIAVVKVQGVIRAYWKGNRNPFFTLCYHAPAPIEQELSLRLGYYPWMDIDLEKHFIPKNRKAEQMHQALVLTATLGIEFFLFSLFTQS